MTEEQKVQTLLNICLFIFLLLTGTKTFSSEAFSSRFNVYFLLFFGSLFFFIKINFKGTLEDLYRRYNPWNKTDFATEDDRIKDFIE